MRKRKSRSDHLAAALWRTAYLVLLAVMAKMNEWYVMGGAGAVIVWGLTALVALLAIWRWYCFFTWNDDLQE